MNKFYFASLIAALGLAVSGGINPSFAGGAGGGAGALETYRFTAIGDINPRTEVRTLLYQDYVGTGKLAGKVFSPRNPKVRISLIPDNGWHNPEFCSEAIDGIYRAFYGTRLLSIIFGDMITNQIELVVTQSNDPGEPELVCRNF